MPEIHKGWERLSHLPSNVVTCPNCGAPHTHKEHNWTESADGATTCTRPSCLERGTPQRVTPGQRRYPPMAH
jgi:hypothetical protein